MNSLWLLSLVCLSSVVVQSQSDLFQFPKRDGRRKFCGKYLADTLSLVCDGTYNKLWDKKDTPYSELQGDDYAYEMPQELAWPILSRQAANSLLPRNDHHRRFRRGVWDECCRKTCTFNELQAYCGFLPSLPTSST